MYHLSHIVHQLYQDFTKKAAKAHVDFNLDFPDTTIKVAHPSEIKQILQRYLEFSLKHRGISPKKSTITISVNENKITIKDSFYSFNPAEIKSFLTETSALTVYKISLTSRIGFGSTFSLALK